MKLLDGKEIAAQKYELLKVQIAEMKRPPSLAIILVGDDYASHMYIGLKEKSAKKVGIDFHKYLFDAGTPQEEILECLTFLREDDDVDGIMVQLPLPEKFDTQAIIDAMGPEKDVDGFHPENLKRFIDGENVHYPVFPQALVSLAEASGKKMDGLNAVLVGRSDIFTSAMKAVCARSGISMDRIGCDQVEGEKEKLQGADIIFSACGTPGIITGDHLKDGVIIVDGGISEKGGETVGDVEFESASKKASHITPIPGGVGPMTVASLLANAVTLSYKRQNS